jgi:hypothetical protein
MQDLPDGFADVRPYASAVAYSDHIANLHAYRPQRRSLAGAHHPGADASTDGHSDRVAINGIAVSAAIAGADSPLRGYERRGGAASVFPAAHKLLGHRIPGQMRLSSRGERLPRLVSHGLRREPDVEAEHGTDGGAYASRPRVQRHGRREGDGRG